MMGPTPVIEGWVVEKIEEGRSRRKVRGDVDKQGMDKYATCICCVMHEKETEVHRGGKVPMEREVIIVVRDLIMGGDIGCIETK